MRRLTFLVGIYASIMLIGVACSAASDQLKSPVPSYPIAAAAGKGSSEMTELFALAWFEKYRTVLSGSYVRSHHLLPRAFDLSSASESIRCNGLAPLVELPLAARPPQACDGMTGVAELRCSDQRVLNLRWAVDPDCGSGFGEGIDRDGNRLIFLFGGSDALMRTAHKEAIENQQGKPPVPAAGEGTEKGVSTGTAFFVSWRGHLITNYHVVEGASKIQVSLGGEELVDARVVHEDRENDLALLQVDAFRTPLLVRKKGVIVRGTSVAALGYPLVPIQGREQKATFGHINALSGILGDDRYTQLDAAVQPGNSGGPVINEEGEVVGVVTLILSPSATLEATGTIPQNVNYAIKSELVHRLLEKVLGSEWKGRTQSYSKMEWPEVLSRIENSVVLVLAEH